MAEECYMWVSLREWFVNVADFTGAMVSWPIQSVTAHQPHILDRHFSIYMHLFDAVIQHIFCVVCSISRCTIGLLRQGRGMGEQLQDESC